MVKVEDKPTYQVPLMPTIQSIPWNGYNVVSTFSGCGGSCLGYLMAGFRVLWASEFVPIAQETYKLNHPDSILDTRDIRKVHPDEILEVIGLQRGELDLLDGSPPCASFSMAGKRNKSWGQIKKYSDTSQRTDDLFFEYARILKGLQPKVFVAENVSGLVKGKAKGYFKIILKELKDCDYQVRAKVLDAQWLGVPQMRQRIIFIGVRNGLGLQPVYPKPLKYRYSVGDALPYISQITKVFWGDAKEEKAMSRDKPHPAIVQHNKGFANIQIEIDPELDISKYAVGKEWDKLKVGENSKKYLQLRKVDPSKPSPTIGQRMGADGGIATITPPTQKRKFTIAELKRICAFPDDFTLIGTYAQQWERLGRAVPPVMMEKIARVIRDEILSKC